MGFKGSGIVLSEPGFKYSGKYPFLRDMFYENQLIWTIRVVLVW